MVHLSNAENPEVPNQMVKERSGHAGTEAVLTTRHMQIIPKGHKTNVLGLSAASPKSAVASSVTGQTTGPVVRVCQEQQG